jgi:GntR family transcriptional regulator
MAEDTSPGGIAAGLSPAWTRLARQLAAEAAAWPDPALRFHSEAEIARRFALSRVTVRRALASLVEAGLLDRVRGSGSFVRAATLAEDLTPTMQVDQGWRALGRVPVARVLACRTMRAGAAAAAALGLKRQARVLFVKRVRGADGLALAVDERLVPADVARACGLDATSAAGSILGRLWRAGPLEAVRWSIAARAPTAEEMRLLGIGPAQPVLIRQMTYTDAAGRRVLTGHSVHRADRVRYTLAMPLHPVPAESALMQEEVAGG